MAKIRLEWVRPGRPDFLRGGSDDFAQFFGQQTLTVSSSSLASVAAPSFTGPDGVTATRGMARVSVVAGAVVIAWGGPSPSVAETTGVRLEAGQVQLFSVDTGDALAFIEALDTPSIKLVQDAAAETGLQAILSALGGVLSVSGPLTNAQATALGLGTSANQAAILAALRGTLAVSGPLTSAQVAALGLGTAANQAAILSALQGTLAVSGPLTNAQAVSLGLGTSANQTAILAALQGPLSATISPIHAVATARSATLVTASTAQDLMPANVVRNGWTIQNQSNGALYVRSKGAAGTSLATLDQNSLIIPPGAAYDPPKVSPHGLSIIGATAGQAFFAEEW